MNLQENINRVKQMMGVLNEQTEKVIEVVTDSFTANDCDELHAFEGTGGKKVGEMQTKMFKKLNDIYQKGINPKVSNVTVTVNDMTVTWTCTIVESTDGKAWVGFTSRGAGCNNNIIARANAEYLTDEKTGESIYVGNDVGTMRKRIKEVYKEPNIEIEDVNDFIYNGGGNSFKQIFYRYTKPISSPPHKSKPITPNPVIPNTQTQPTTGTQTATTGGETPTATVQTTGGETPPNQQPATMEFKYPSIDNPFKPTNGDPWEYAHDGTNLYVRNPKGSNKLFNLKDPNYSTTYPGSKLKTQDQVNNAIASIKNAYGKELGL